MATVSVANHASGALVRLTCAFTTPDTGSKIAAFRTVPGGGTTRLRLTRGVIVGGSSLYSGLVTPTDFPVAGFTPSGSSYSGVILLDAEPPQGVVPSYYIEVRNSVGTLVDSSTATAAPVAPSMGGDFLYDLSRLARGMVVNVTEFNEVATAAKTVVSTPLGGSSGVVGLDLVGLPSFTLKLATLTLTEARNLRGLLRVGGPVYALSPKTLGYGFDGPVYFAVTDFRESRATNLGAETARLWTLSCQQVQAPGSYFGAYPGNGATVASAWSSFFTSYAAESFGVVNGNLGHPYAYPTGVVS